jgi:enoyl-CoA hydratase/carnithine racemase
MTDHLLQDRQGRVLILTINNPAKRNAFSPELYRGAHAALCDAETDPGIGAVVFTGANGIFCAGGDITRMYEDRNKDPREQRDRVELLNIWIEKMRTFPKPIIAAVEGAAAGAGFALALACDLIVSAEDARWTMAHVKIGANPDGGGSLFLCRGLPHQLAAELMLEGGLIAPARLHSLGIVNKVCAPGAAFETAAAWAARLAEGPGASMGRIKDLLERSYGIPVRPHLGVEADYINQAIYHPEGQEGIAAFMEKRKPAFPRG